LVLHRKSDCKGWKAEKEAEC